MTITRDSITLTVGAIASVSAGFVSAFHLFPWLSVDAQHTISLVAFGCGSLAAYLKTSPLPVSPEGHVAEVKAHNAAVDQAVTEVQVLARTPPIPPVTPAA